ncbi:MAG: hypothetical protein EBZ49_00395 [Proteobacteria bacterium]|nr:hypothetical protein [Pseudomonadota bacterium]
MPTLQDILEKDLGLGSEQPQTEKVASQDVAESDDIEKLAMEIGLINEEDVTNSASQEQTTELKKEAKMSLDNLYSELFPGDADVVGATQEKVASEENEMEKQAAAVEEAIGELAYDHFENLVDAHITKMASAIWEEMQKEAGADQAMASNEVSDGQGVDTTPEVEDSVKETSPEGAVGEYEQKKGPMGELKQAALRKQILLSQLEG